MTIRCPHCHSADVWMREDGHGPWQDTTDGRWRMAVYRCRRCGDFHHIQRERPTRQERLFT